MQCIATRTWGCILTVAIIAIKLAGREGQISRRRTASWTRQATIRNRKILTGWFQTTIDSFLRLSQMIKYLIKKFDHVCRPRFWINTRIIIERNGNEVSWYEWNISLGEKINRSLIKKNNVRERILDINLREREKYINITYMCRKIIFPSEFSLLQSARSERKLNCASKNMNLLLGCKLLIITRSCELIRSQAH